MNMVLLIVYLCPGKRNRINFLYWIYVKEIKVNATMASIAAVKPGTTILEKKVKMISKNIPANTHSFNLSKRPGISSSVTPDNLAWPRM